MKRTFTLACFCLLQLGTVHNVVADPNVKFGEWEVSIEMTGMPMAMPPQTQRFCVDKQHMVPGAKQEQGCNIEWNSSGNTITWTLNCANGGNGKGSVTYNWDKMTGNSEVNVPQAQMVMKSKMTGKWVKDKCSSP